MTEYYQEKLQQGLEYQDFVITQLKRMDGMPPFSGTYASKKYQYEKGESSSGIEIKFDGKMHETGNLFIEIEEKTNPNNEKFVASGVMRRDNSWLYLIGNYEQAFIFATSTLRYVCEHKADKVVQSKIGTSQGCLLSIEELEAHPHWYAKRIFFENSAGTPGRKA